MTTIILLFATETPVTAQALRSSGLGFRASFWTTSEGLFSFTVTRDVTERQEVFLNGFIGGWLNYYSRINDRWFLEFSLGTMVNAEAETRVEDFVKVEAGLITPFLFGARFDLLSLRGSGALQPYLSFGGGPYWQTVVLVDEDSSIGNTEVTVGNSRLDIGGYFGAGVNIAPVSWFAFTFDMKYHAINLEVGNGNSGFDFGIGVTFMWGKKREIFRIRQTKVIVKDIYPAYYQFYNTYPVALVSVQNTAGYPIDVNVKSSLRPFSRRIKDSGFITLERGETADIPATIVFGPEVNQLSRRHPAVLKLEVEGRGGTRLKRDTNAQLIIHTRNSWNGEMDKLGFFVTADDPEIIQLSRNWLNNMPDSLRKKNRNLATAKMLFEEIRKLSIRYQTDPTIPFYQDDRVQYAAETLDLKSGDCDDLVILYASLLQSLGIRTAFVEVRDPEKSLAHLYLMFDTGISPEQAHLISSNEKRYIIREKYQPGSLIAENTHGDDQSEIAYAGGNEAPGDQSIWVPVETTLINRGFEAAWKSGALQYLQEAKMRNGISEGWVTVIDVK